MKMTNREKGSTDLNDPITRPRKLQESINSFVMSYVVDKWREVYDKAQGKENKERVMQFVKLETEGGRCFNPDCLKNWIHVKKQNLYYLVDYYHPGCYCFFRCPLCGRSNHYEMESGVLHKRGYRCDCGWKLLDGEKNEIKKHGAKFEKQNWDFLNKIRLRQYLYFIEFDGSLVMERKMK